MAEEGAAFEGFITLIDGSELLLPIRAESLALAANWAAQEFGREHVQIGTVHVLTLQNPDERVVLPVRSVVKIVVRPCSDTAPSESKRGTGGGFA